MGCLQAVGSLGRFCSLLRLNICMTQEKTKQENRHFSAGYSSNRPFFGSLQRSTVLRPGDSAAKRKLVSGINNLLVTGSAISVV